jgi:hypothetical protein
MQGLNDTGFSIAADGSTYWVGETMQATDYRDLNRTGGHDQDRRREHRPSCSAVGEPEVSA